MFPSTRVLYRYFSHAEMLPFYDKLLDHVMWRPWAKQNSFRQHNGQLGTQVILKIWIGFSEHGIPKENVQCNITMTDVSKDALYYWTGLMLVLGLIQELKHSYILCEVK